MRYAPRCRNLCRELTFLSRFLPLPTSSLAFPQFARKEARGEEPFDFFPCDESGCMGAHVCNTRVRRGRLFPLASLSLSLLSPSLSLSSSFFSSAKPTLNERSHYFAARSFLRSALPCMVCTYACVCVAGRSPPAWAPGAAKARARITHAGGAIRRIAGKATFSRANEQSRQRREKEEESLTGR